MSTFATPTGTRGTSTREAQPGSSTANASNAARRSPKISPTKAICLRRRSGFTPRPAPDSLTLLSCKLLHSREEMPRRDWPQKRSSVAKSMPAFCALCAFLRLLPGALWWRLRRAVFLSRHKAAPAVRRQSSFSLCIFRLGIRRQPASLIAEQVRQRSHFLVTFASPVQSRNPLVPFRPLRSGTGRAAPAGAGRWPPRRRQTPRPPHPSAASAPAAGRCWSDGPESACGAVPRPG